MKLHRLTLAVLLIPSLLLADGRRIHDRSSASTLVTVDGNNSMRATLGPAGRQGVWVASISNALCNNPATIEFDSGPDFGLVLLGWCGGITSGIAAGGTGVTVKVARRVSAGSGGTAVTWEGATSPAVSRVDQSEGHYPGKVWAGLLTGGTVDAVLDQVGFTTGEVGTGSETVPSYPFCQSYGKNGAKPPIVPAGSTSGISVVMGSGTGGSLCDLSVTVAVTAVGVKQP